MGREKYRHRIMILRREDGPEAGGGYEAEPYGLVGETSCRVRDETETEFAAAESARIGHVVTFEMRIRDIRDDDLLIWQGKAYRVRRVDHIQNDGREIRVRAEHSASRYTIKG